ncbi:MAG: hypothetical protein ABIW82_16450 [Dokdonella sp.]
MTRAIRLAGLLVLLALLFPEFGRYRAEWMLSAVHARLDRALRGIDRGEVAMTSVGIAADQAQQAAAFLPGDPRPPMLQGIALILGGKGAQAVAVLDAAIAQGERPEFTINLGRARTILGDEAGAHAAYLRTAWASTDAIATLPKAVRESLLAEVSVLEGDLRAQKLVAPPPLQ